MTNPEYDIPKELTSVTSPISSNSQGNKIRKWVAILELKKTEET